MDRGVCHFYEQTLVCRRRAKPQGRSSRRSPRCVSASQPLCLRQCTTSRLTLQPFTFTFDRVYLLNSLQASATSGNPRRRQPSRRAVARKHIQDGPEGVASWARARQSTALQPPCSGGLRPPIGGCRSVGTDSRGEPRHWRGSAPRSPRVGMARRAVRLLRRRHEPSDSSGAAGGTSCRGLDPRRWSLDSFFFLPF